MEQMVIFSAPWVVPVGAPVIQDGSVVVNDGRIVDIGSRSALGQKYPQSLEKGYAGVLMPGLVNAHMHLELSHLATRIESLPDQHFTDWIDTLIRARTQHSVYREEIVAAFTAALDEQYAAGVALIGDIGNEYYQELHRDNGDSRPRIVRMLEFLGPNRKACRIVLEKLKGLDEQIAATAHAPYSTPPALLWSLKARCSRFRHVFSIHTGECSEERDFVSSGSAAFRQFLEKKKSWDGVFPFAVSGYSGVIEYFDQLGARPQVAPGLVNVCRLCRLH